MLTIREPCFGLLDRVILYLKIVIQDIEQEDDPGGAKLCNPKEALRESMIVNVFVVEEAGIGVFWMDLL